MPFFALCEQGDDYLDNGEEIPLAGLAPKLSH